MDLEQFTETALQRQDTESLRKLARAEGLEDASRLPRHRLIRALAIDRVSDGDQEIEADVLHVLSRVRPYVGGADLVTIRDSVCKERNRRQNRETIGFTVSQIQFVLERLKESGLIKRGRGTFYFLSEADDVEPSQEPQRHRPTQPLGKKAGELRELLRDHAIGEDSANRLQVHIHTFPGAAHEINLVALDVFHSAILKGTLTHAFVRDLVSLDDPVVTVRNLCERLEEKDANDAALLRFIKTELGLQHADCDTLPDVPQKFTAKQIIGALESQFFTSGELRQIAELAASQLPEGGRAELLTELNARTTQELLRMLVELGMSQHEIARQVGTEQSQISRVLAGQQPREGLVQAVRELAIRCKIL